jgi:predicted flap endonuclease-1-like 5' DNA nuclease
LLNSTRNALRQKEGMCAAAKAEALALNAGIAECDAALVARTRELAVERADVQGARKQISELKTGLAAKEQRIAELESLLSKQTGSKPFEPKLLDSPHPSLAGQNGLAFTQPLREHADDLTQVHGIGRVFEEVLNGIGIRYFSQIAAWTDQDVEQVTALRPGLKKRITKDRWIESARQQNEKKYGRALRRMAS